MSKARVSPTPPDKTTQDLVDSVSGFMHNNVYAPPLRSNDNHVYARKNSRGYLPPLQATKDPEFNSEAAPPAAAAESGCTTLTKRYFGDLRSAARSIFYLVCIGYSSLQIFRTTVYYMEFDTGVAVGVEEPQTLKEAMPGTTVCNKNLVTKV